MVAVIAAGTFITALDQTVVVTALPAVMADLRIPLARLDAVIWVVTAYLLGYTVAMPLLGRLADVYGYTRVYHCSLLIFCVGTTLVALSGRWDWLNLALHTLLGFDALDQLLAARVIQAVGGGGAVPVSLAIAAALVRPEQRGMALGIVAGAAEAGSMLGPAYGAAVIEIWNWRGIFWLNIPQAAVIAAALLFLPNRRFTGVRMDYRGALLLTTALVLLSLALAHPGLFRLSSWTPYLMLVGFFVAAVILALSHLRTTQPLLSAALFRAGAFVAANLAQLGIGIALIIAIAATVIMANTVMDVPERPVDPLTAALWLLRMTGTIPVFSVVGGLFLRWIDARWITVSGLALIAIGMFQVGGWPLINSPGWPIEISDPKLTVDMVIAGVGFGLVIAPLMHRAILSAPSDYWAVSASMIVVARMLGMTLGLAALSAWGINELLTVFDQTVTLPPARRAAVISAVSLDLFHAFFRTAGIIAIIAIIPTVLMRASPDERAAASTPADPEPTPGS